MTFLEAAENVLRASGRAMTSAEITSVALEQGLVSTTGKTPAETMNAQLCVHLKKSGKKTFLRVAPGVWGLVGRDVPQKAKRTASATPCHVGDVGFVYVLTNPSFRKDWVKIGMTERPVNTRSKELDNTAVPLPFEIYATLKTRHRRKIEHLLHGFIDEIAPSKRIRKTREFFNIPPETALRLLKKAAEAFDEEKYIETTRLCKNIPPSKPVRAIPKTSSHESKTWKTKTQLARLLARQGGNEGAFGGILQYFQSESPRRCPVSSKWRSILEDAGIVFGKDDFIKDWSRARNPL